MMEQRIAKLEGAFQELSKRLDDFRDDFNHRLDDLRTHVDQRFRDQRLLLYILILLNLVILGAILGMIFVPG